MSPQGERGLAPVGAAAISSGPEAPSLARTLVSEWLDGRAQPQLHDDVRLLVSELVANSVRHAGQPAGAPVHLRAAAVDGVVRVEVEDHGHGRVRRRAADRRRGGFGLCLVERLADRWGVNHENGTCVWFELAPHGPDT
jgi:anti-sigma regulatory factor (Ser/Thr protein kinase)